jgi:hypothetical protein
MTLKEDEGIHPNPALSIPRQQAGSEKSAKTRVQFALIRSAELAAVIPVIILLLPVYALIQIYAASVCIHRLVRGKILRHIPDMRSVIPDACAASQNLKLR